MVQYAYRNQPLQARQCTSSVVASSESEPRTQQSEPIFGQVSAFSPLVGSSHNPHPSTGDKQQFNRNSHHERTPHCPSPLQFGTNLPLCLYFCSQIPSTGTSTYNSWLLSGRSDIDSTKSHFLLLHNELLQEVYHDQTFKKGFLQDSGCYPIIVIMGFITCVVVGMSAHQIVSLKDLRISSKTKHSTLQNWGQEHHDSVTSRWAKGPMIMNGAEHRATWREGLGVNHDEWLKQKEAKDAEKY